MKEFVENEIELIYNDNPLTDKLSERLRLICQMINQIDSYTVSGETEYDVFKQIIDYLEKTQANHFYEYIKKIFIFCTQGVDWDEICKLDKYFIYLSYKMPKDKYKYRFLSQEDKLFVTNFCVIIRLISKHHALTYNKEIDKFISTGFTCYSYIKIDEMMNKLYNNNMFSSVKQFSSKLVEFEEKWLHVKNLHEQSDENERGITNLQPNQINDNKLIILKRYNSIYPGIRNFNNFDIRGGGFYFKWKGVGVAIDPGFDFYSNLIETGMSVADIKYIFVTHAHDDHCRDLEILFSLNYKRNQLHGQDDILFVFGSENICKKYSFLNHKFIKNIVSISDDEKGLNISSILAKNKTPIELIPIKAYHNESPYSLLGRGSCHGFVLKLYDTTMYNYQKDKSVFGGLECTLLYTGDTSYNNGLAREYSGYNPDIVIMNIGKIETEVAFPDKNHLGIKGCMNIVESLMEKRCNTKLIIISEYGIEMKDHRIDIADLITTWISLNNAQYGSAISKILPGDIGLIVNLKNYKVLSNRTNRWKNAQNIRCVYENDNIIYH